MPKKKRPFWIFFFLTLIVLVLVFRNALLQGVVNIGVRHFYPDLPLTYDSVAWDKDAIVIKNIHLAESNYHVDIKEARVKGKVNFSPFSFEPIITLTDPVVLLGQDNAGINSFTGMNLNIDIPQGRLILGDEELYFRYLREGSSFSLSYDPDFSQTALFSADIETTDDDKYNVKFALHEIESANLIQLIAGFYPQLREGWDHLEGNLKIRGSGTVTLPFAIETLEAEVEAQNLKILNNQLNLDTEVEYFHGQIAFPSGEEQPFWRQIIASLSVTQGHIGFGQWGLFAENAQMTLDPEMDPYLSLKGSFMHGDTEYPLELEGKGSMHEDQTFWLEVLAKSSPEEEIFLSVCSPEKGFYILQGDFKNLQPNLFINDLKGSFNGRATGWIKDSQLERVHFENVVGKNVTIQDLSCEELKGEGSFVVQNEKCILSAINLNAQNAKIQQLSGNFGIKIDEGFISLKNSEVKGSLFYETNEISFGYQWKELEIKEGQGWFRASNLPKSLHSLPIEGDVSVEGSFNSESAQLTLDGKQVQWENFAAEKVKGAKINYDRKTKKFQGMIPFENGIFIKNDFLIENLQGVLHIDEKKIQGEFVNGSISLTPTISLSDLICQVDYDFQNKQCLIEKGRSHINFNGKVYPVLLDRIALLPNEAAFDVSLFDNETEMARLAGTGNLEKFQFHFNSSTHILGMKPNSLSVSLNPEHKLHVLWEEKAIKCDAICCLDEFGVKGDARLCLNTTLGELSSETAFPFTYKMDQGFNLEKACFCNPQGKIDVQNFSYLAKKGKAEKINFDWNILSNHLTGQACFECDENNFFLEGKFADTSITLFNQSWDLKDVGFSVDSKIANVHAKSFLFNQPVSVALGIDFSNAGTALLKIDDLKMIYRNQTFESIQGSLLGLDVNLTNNQNLFSGSIKGNLSTLFPKLGNGYELVGDFDLSQMKFKGKLGGEKFEVGAFQFDHLQAKLEATKERIEISDLKITDRAGELSVKQLKCLNAGSWVFDMPLLQISHFIPSRLKNGVEKPFTISHLSLMDLQGEITDPSTWVGAGEITFTNKEKKEASFFDAPLELIKDIGIDPDLFTPQGGELECTLKNNKLYFKALTNSFSEGQRSEFYLAPLQSSFLTLSGDINIDLKMRQNVLINLTESMTLKIRGTVDQPRYQLAP